MPQTRRVQRRAYVIDAIVDGASRIFDSIFSGFFSTIQKQADGMMDNVEKRVFLIQKRLMDRLIMGLLVGLGSLFLVFSAYFYLTEIRLISKSGAFLLLAIALFVAVWIIKKTRGANHEEAQY